VACVTLGILKNLHHLSWPDLFCCVLQLHEYKSSSHRIFRLNNIAKALKFLEDSNVSVCSTSCKHEWSLTKRLKFSASHKRCMERVSAEMARIT
jgi:hypothetical protein